MHFKEAVDAANIDLFPPMMVRWEEARRKFQDMPYLIDTIPDANTAKPTGWKIESFPLQLIGNVYIDHLS